jgi:hypothetical protein
MRFALCFLLGGRLRPFALFAALTAGLSAQPIRLENPGTDHVYFSYHGKPLLSFGVLSDYIFYTADDAFDYRRWADWAAAHGMNHCRAYLPGSWTYIEHVTDINGGARENVLFPFRETAPGSRKFDVTQFDERYWRRFREQCEYLQSKGIIIDLLMWNGWQLWNYNRDIARTNWDGHFFNPANNVNAFTAHLSTAKEGGARLQFYHTVVDGREE